MFRLKIPSPIAEKLIEFKNSSYAHQFPSISTSILTSVGILFTSKNSRTIFRHPISFIRKNLLEDEKIPVFEAQAGNKPTLAFDFSNFLCCDRFSLKRFDRVFIRRSFCEEFLFNLVPYYELVCVSSRLPVMADWMLSRIDPLGCIGYRVYVKDKKSFTLCHLNRNPERVAVISTKKNEFHDDFERNILMIQPYNGKNESGLLSLMHFFLNLHFSLDKSTIQARDHIKCSKNSSIDFRNILESYRGSNFLESFQGVQERLFNQRNMLSFASFEQKLNEINRSKIEEYKKVKDKIRNERNSNWNYVEILDRLVRGILL